MFARATVCNIFLIAKVWYVLQALCMSRVNVQKLHRVFAVFIWSSSWERSSRTNLFRSVRSGGLGLSHLFIRQIVSRFLFLRDQDDPFSRTVIQLRFRNVLPEFVVSSSSVMCSGVQGYMREVLSSFQILKARFSLEYLSSVTRKRMYKHLVDVLIPIPVYRSLPHGCPGQDVLKRVKKRTIKPAMKSFFLKIALRCSTCETLAREERVIRSMVFKL